MAPDMFDARANAIRMELFDLLREMDWVYQTSETALRPVSEPLPYAWVAETPDRCLFADELQGHENMVRRTYKAVVEELQDTLSRETTAAMLADEA